MMQYILGVGKFTSKNPEPLQNSPEHHANIKCDVSYGQYSWCGNMYHDEIPGYYMSCSQQCDKDKLTGKQMIHINIVMNDQLANTIDIIEIYDINGALVNYSLDLSHEITYDCFFVCEEDIKETELKILFRKYCPEIPHGILRRMPMQTIHTETHLIPKLNLLGSTECAICLLPVSCDIHITECKHTFHTQCIWNYLSSLGCIKEDTCTSVVCEHGDKAKSFKCPVCRSVQHNGVTK